MKLIKLTKNQFSIIDDEDLERVSRIAWFANKTDSKFRVMCNKRFSGYIYLHQFLMCCPKGMTVDHIDGNPLNNQKSNLRICSIKNNSRNKGFSKNNTSGFKGVVSSKSWCPTKPWLAQIKVNYKTKKVGYFRTKKEAAMAYDLEAKKHFGEFAKTNF